jgi:hypothetical protein
MPECLVRFHLVQGAKSDHFWQIPVLLTPLEPDDRTKGFRSGVDRIAATDGAFVAPEAIEQLQILLLMVVRRIPLAKTEKARNQAMVDLAQRIAGLTHYVSRHEFLIAGWMSETLMTRIVHAAIDLPELQQESMQRRKGRPAERA